MNLLLAGLTLASCSPGHVGGNEIAFVRGGALWTIDPSGANAFAVATQDTAVVGYSWSPSHQILAFRTLDADYAKTAAGKQGDDPILGLRGDVPSTVNTIGIDGGSAIPVFYSSSGVQYSNPIWNASSSRLLYRQESQQLPFHPDSVSWQISQNDQPAGIATKPLPPSYSIPSFAPDGQTLLGNFTKGIFSVGVGGTDQRYLLPGQLPGHPLPASLERVLWQPAHSQPALLYASAPDPQQSSRAGEMSVQLIMRTPDQQSHILTTCTCTQFAWSPDGTMLLYNTKSASYVYTIATRSAFELSPGPEAGSVPYWSPDSRFLLFDGPQRLLLVRIANHEQQTLLQDTAGTGAQPSGLPPDADTLLQPAPNSPWAADSRHFLFLTRARLLWQGHALSSGKGLYTATIDDNGRLQGAPSIVDTGNDTQAGWTYEDANTSYLF